MASRNQYTVTPSYGGNQRQMPPRIMQNPVDPQPGEPRRPTAPTSQKTTNDTFILTMLFIVAPVCGLLGLPILAFRWIFIALSAFLIITIWLTKRFMFQGRAFLSGILVVAAVVSLISAVDTKAAEQAQLNLYSPGDPLLGSLMGSSLAQGDQSGLSASPTNPIGIQGEDSGAQTEQQPPAQDSLLAIEPTPTEAPQRVYSDAEKALDNYMQMWQNEDYEGMTRYTLPSWRNAQRVPAMQLSFQHANYILNQWEISSENQATAIDSATFTVIVNVTKNAGTKATVYGKYSAIVFNNEGMWYVDPNSMRSMLAYEPEPQLVANEGDTYLQQSSEAEPTPEPTASPKTKLYYNSDGGKFYHADEKCSAIDPKYYTKMKSFTYADLSKSGYSKLKPCTTCKAPK